LIKPAPNARVRDWVAAQDNATLYLSVVSVGELRSGITLLPQSKRRQQLEQWFKQVLLPLFAGRILPVNQSVSDRWGVLDGESQLRGSPLNTVDGMIAATALEHELTLVTRNAKDFVGLGITVLNPWGAV
jgi:predicted nucleic acid-binding protein